ncbi:MAG: DUF2274 domain-containing protein [Mesorhizobium sp.]|nr:MAG: DUF2274 domain-containing protein [Mesorhizobium sp.]
MSFARSAGGPSDPRGEVVIVILPLVSNRRAQLPSAARRPIVVPACRKRRLLEFRDGSPCRRRNIAATICSVAVSRSWGKLLYCRYEPARLIAPIIERFIATDRASAQVRRNRQHQGTISRQSEDPIKKAAPVT